MSVVEPECVRRLLESSDPDVALVFVRGECRVLPPREIDARHRRLVIVRRQDIPEVRAGARLTDEQIEALACRLDNAARDFCG